KVKVDILDDQSDENVADSIARHFAAAGAGALIGPFGHALATSTEPLTYEAKLLQIASNLASIELACAEPANDRYFFSLVPTNATSAGMTLFALDGPPGLGACTEAVLVRADDSLGQAFEDALGPLYTSGGGHLLAVLQITAQPTIDYSATVAALYAKQ